MTTLTLKMTAPHSSTYLMAKRLEVSSFYSL